MGGAFFEGVILAFDLAAGRLETTTQVSNLFGGRANIGTEVDLTGAAPAWELEPDLQGVNSERLLAWLDTAIAWNAPMALSGTLRATGNSSEALRDSAAGELFFDGTEGTLDITSLKEPVLAVATAVGQGDKVANWKDRWDYTRFTGTWHLNGEQHRIGFAIDNLNVQASGQHRWREDELALSGTATVGSDPAFSSFDIDPLLYDLPIPVRCNGSLVEPECKLDEDGGKRVIAQVLRGEAGEPLRARLQEELDKVPEQLRGAARSLLDALGSALDGT